MKYLYYPDTLYYAGTVPDESQVPFCLSVEPPPNRDPDKVVVADPSNGVWVMRLMNEEEVGAAQEAAMARISAACEQACLAGFYSSALGKPYMYPSSMKDQQNLNAAVTASLLPGVGDGWTVPFSCVDEDENWSLMPHTAAQIQQVNTDGLSMIAANRQRNFFLRQRIGEAKSYSQIAAVTWS